LSFFDFNWGGEIMNYYEQQNDLCDSRFTCICGKSNWGNEMVGDDHTRYCPEHRPKKAPVIHLVREETSQTSPNKEQQELAA